MGNAAPTTGRSSQTIARGRKLAIYNGRVTAAFIRRGTGYSDIDKTIVNWIETRWRTYDWFRGGSDFLIFLNVDPTIRQIVFRKS